MLEINGAYHEGGGSIIRLSVALSFIIQKPVRVYNIRSQRREKGLKTQHLRAIEAIADFCGGTLEGAQLGSSEVTFIPGTLYKSKLDVRIDTAGSVGLLLQALALPCFYGSRDVSVHITGGGTFGTHAPNIIYIQEVLCPIMQKFGFHMEIKVNKHGFYPKGGADVDVHIKRVQQNKGISLQERGKLLRFDAHAVATSDLETKNVCERMIVSAHKLLPLDIPFNKAATYTPSLSTGCGILLKAVYENCVIAWDALGERNKLSEEVGEEAARGLLGQIKTNCTVDEYMTDQILVFMALTKQSFSIIVPRLSSHAKTNIWLIEQFLPVKFGVENNVVTCGPVV